MALAMDLVWTQTADGRAAPCVCQILASFFFSSPSSFITCMYHNHHHRFYVSACCQTDIAAPVAVMDFGSGVCIVKETMARPRIHDRRFLACQMLRSGALPSN